MDVVIEVGPGTIRGPNNVRPESVCAAIECIDDEIALVDDHPVSVRDVWDDVMTTAAGKGVDTVVLVCPAWWSRDRLDTAQHAARSVATDVVMLERIAVLREGISAETTIVEITSDMAIVTVFGRIVGVVPRHADLVADADAVVASLGSPAGVLVDAPVGVLGAELIATSIVDRLRGIGVPVRVADDDWIRRAAAVQRSRVQPAECVGREQGRLHDRRTPAVLFGVLATVALCGGVALLDDSNPDRHVDDMPMTLLVEGRVGVMVPAMWSARRVTSGPGSARVQVVSPNDEAMALHITQSIVERPSSLAATADSLHAALTGTTDGAFVDFNPSDRRADRDAVTYREIRPGRHVDWTVVIDGSARIAIGCQSVAGREHLVREACDRAIRSAHAVGGR